MPVMYYTEEEYRELLRDRNGLESRVKALEELRPVWAQGYSSDSLAAQAHANALSTVWAMLGASNQTEAVSKLSELTK